MSLLPCSCGAPCFGQWFSGTARQSGDQVYVCAESVCALRPFLGSSQRTRLQMNRRQVANVYAGSFCLPFDSSCISSSAQRDHRCDFTHFRKDLTSAQRWCLTPSHLAILSPLAWIELHFKPFTALFCVSHIKGGSGFVPHDCLCMWFQLISRDADGSSSCKHCGWVSNTPGQNGNEAMVSCGYGLEFVLGCKNQCQWLNE